MTPEWLTTQKKSRAIYEIQSLNASMLRCQQVKQVPVTMNVVHGT